MHPFCASTVVNNKFEVHGDNGRFYWHVYGKRGDINVEPIKANVNVKGFGPYKFMEN
jgi:hypothetical protein